MMQAIIFLIDAVISFFCTLFLLRFMMQAMRVSFAGQPGNFVVALTNWAVKPLRRIIPGIGGLDWSSVFTAFALQLMLTGIVVVLSGRVSELDPLGLAPLILQAVLSWINPYSPIAAPAQQLTRPILDPIRRLVPLIGGVDLSPLVAILLLQVVLMLL
jgi:YggT family protein